MLFRSACRVFGVLLLHLTWLEQTEFEQFLVHVYLGFLLPIAMKFADRGAGYAGRIVILDRLPGRPLERPPLSKTFLQNTNQDESKFWLRRDEWFAAQDVTLIDGHAVTHIDAAGQTVRLDDRSEWGYDNLILATGAVPRQLEATHGLDRVFVLRDPTHARQLRAAMATSGTAIVIGGGYIGLEAAASMAKAGITVHVIEMAPRLLARVASPQMSDFFATLQQSYGVHIHTGQQQEIGRAHV